MILYYNLQDVRLASYFPLALQTQIQRITMAASLALTLVSIHGLHQGAMASFSGAWTVRPAAAPRRIKMIRNVDPVELLLVDVSGGFCAEDLERIVEEALEQGIGVAVAQHAWVDGSGLDHLGQPDVLTFVSSEEALTSVRRRARIQPTGFGGSDGFGSKPAEGERVPLPARCVVISDDRAVTIEAMAAGMRSLGIVEPSWTSDDVSIMDASCDVLLDDLVAVGIDDMATPGSFWLNPPLPRTPDGMMLPDPDEEPPSEPPSETAGAEWVGRARAADSDGLGTSQSDAVPASGSASPAPAQAEPDDDDEPLLDVGELRAF